MTIGKLLKRSFRLCKSRVSNFNSLEMRNKWKQHVFSCFSILIEFLKSGFWLSWTFFNIAAKLKELESCATSQMKAKNKSFRNLVKTNWRVLVCSQKGVNFALRVKKSGDFYNINIVMFETEEECSKYMIEMEVFRNDSPPASRHSVKFRGNPSSIDKTKEEIKNVGLLVPLHEYHFQIR